MDLLEDVHELRLEGIPWHPVARPVCIKHRHHVLDRYAGQQLERLRRKLSQHLGYAALVRLDFCISRSPRGAEHLWHIFNQLVSMCGDRTPLKYPAAQGLHHIAALRALGAAHTHTHPFEKHSNIYLIGALRSRRDQPLQMLVRECESLRVESPR